MTDAQKAAAFLRTLPGNSRQRGGCERAAALIEQQAHRIEKQMRIYADQAMEIIELRAQLEGVRAVIEPAWGGQG